MLNNMCCHPKQVLYIAGNQCISSKLIFLPDNAFRQATTAYSP